MGRRCGSHCRASERLGYEAHKEGGLAPTGQENRKQTYRRIVSKYVRGEDVPTKRLNENELEPQHYRRGTSRKGAP